MLEMLLERPEVPNTLAFVAMALGCEVFERAIPYQKLDRRSGLKRDVLAFVVLALVLPRASELLGPACALLEREAVLPLLEPLRTLPSAVKLPLGLVLLDFLFFGIHCAMHRSDFLWRLHEWHHSSEQLYWFSGFRSSVVAIFVYSAPQVGVAWLLRPSALEALIGGLVALFFQLWTHTNVPLRLAQLEWVVVSPRYHRVHHAVVENRYANLATMFPVWDHLFGTYVDPASLAEGVQTGLGYRKSALRMILGV
jgi:sterol desaturase/sphingolipid hydroxylase (fatty acid hydroxylase superfamily)